MAPLMLIAPMTEPHEEDERPRVERVADEAEREVARGGNVSALAIETLARRSQRNGIKQQEHHIKNSVTPVPGIHRVP